MKNKTLLWVGIGSAILIGGGLAWYFSNRKKQTAKMAEDYKAQTSTDTETDTSTSTSTSTSSSSSSKPSGFGRTETLAFQKYANSKGYTPRLAEDGIWGSKTQAAWNKLGEEYRKGAKTSQATETKKSNLIYLKGDGTSIYKFPEFKGEFILGRIDKSFFLDKPFGKAISDLGNGWIKFETFAYLPKCAPNERCTQVVKKETAYIRKEFVSDKPF